MLTCMHNMSRIVVLSVLITAGCRQDPLEVAAAAGDANAQFLLAGKIEKARPEDARRYLTLAAGKGVKDAQYKLGMALMDGGMGFPIDKAKGVFWLEKAANEGHPVAAARLTHAYALGTGVRRDPARALRWADLNSENLDPEVALVIGSALLDGTRTYKDVTRGKELLEHAAAQGQTKAMVTLLKHLEAQDAKGESFTQLLPRWKKAAELGEPEACGRWGSYLYYGVGVPADPNQALKFLETAATADIASAIHTAYWAHNNPKVRKGNPQRAYQDLSRISVKADGETFFLLARCHHYGQGVEKDPDKELAWLRKAEAAGHERAIAAIGWAYEHGTNGLEKNLEMASRNYLAAARLGNHRCFDLAANALLELGQSEKLLEIIREAEPFEAPNCRFWLGFHYHHGHGGVAKDERRAAGLYELSAAAGNNFAKTHLASLLMEGKGVSKEVERACLLTKEAAVGGIAQAQFNLACYLEQGKGMAQDSGMAYFWANLAASQEDNESFAKLRDLLSKKIGTAETLRMQALCRDWLNRARERQSQPEGPDPDATAGGSGSGIIFSTQGHVLTNHHVIAGCNSFKVVTADGKEHDATLVASDEKLDVAVLKISGIYSNRTFRAPPTLTSSAQVRSGQKVFTVGHPLGELLSSEAKYNDGTVSAMSGMGDDQRVMQISVPIQPGNSGGPLANMNGEVVGLIVASVNGGALLRQTNILAQNINFAIKSDPIIEFLTEKSLPVNHGRKSGEPIEHVKAYSVKVVANP